MRNFAHWMYYLNKKEESINIIRELTEKEPKNGIYQDTLDEILMCFEQYDEAVKKFLKAMVIGSDDWYSYQTYIKLRIFYKALEKCDLAIKNLKEGKNLANKSTSDPETKQKWLAITALFLAEIESL